ncbi:MAG: FecR domain-containing protein [Desulfobacterales bacterium]|nr:FecR domain-containing protein [Desulfobacterales bacterium]
MKLSERKKNYILCAVSLFFIACAFVSSAAYADSMIPEDMVIKDTFSPGIGLPVGKVQLVMGQAVIIHETDMSIGYRAVKNMPVYNGDTIITLEKGRISFRMKDKSVLSLNEKTNLVINESLFDPKNKSRTTYMNMTLGKARFWVKKLFKFKRSEFKVKTKTAIIGVRGSDFVIEATDLSTRVITFEDNLLEIISLIAPCQEYSEIEQIGDCEVKPTFLADFEEVVIEKGALLFEPETLLPEEAEQEKKEFPSIPETDEPVETTEQGVVISADERVTPEEMTETLPIEEFSVQKDEFDQIQEENIPEQVTEVREHIEEEEKELPMPPSEP